MSSIHLRQTRRTIRNRPPQPPSPAIAEGLESRRLLSAALPNSYLIDCGAAAAYAGYDGQTWSADQGYSGGGACSAIYTVPGTADATLYYTRRTGASFTYDLPVANGTYSVRLCFSDPTYSAVGQRRFDVSIEGKAVLKDFDLVSNGGGKAPVVGNFISTVTDGELDVAFTGVVSNATVSALQVMPLGTTPAPTPTPTPTPTPAPAGANPIVTGISFGQWTTTTNVPTNAFIAAAIRPSNSGAPIAMNTIYGPAEALYPTALGPNQAVECQQVLDQNGTELLEEPEGLLQPNTQYTFVVTGAMKDTNGVPVKPFSMTFTTGSSGPSPNPAVHFTQVAQATTNGNQYSDVKIGPDGRLWASTLDGRILAFPINAAGNLGSPQTYRVVASNNGGKETIIGITFDPASTAANPILWVDESQGGLDNAADFTGKVALVSGPNLSQYQDVVVGLPRSIRDHMTNQSAFGPDGALYVAQGANTAMGGLDPAWGNRPERLLSGAILRLDTQALLKRLAAGQGALNAKTPDGGGSYNPYAAGAPVTLYATGVRNAYSLLWADNGHLYAPNNGSSAGSNTPAPPGKPQLGLNHVGQTEWDWLLDVKPGKYYGHPDPARGQYILNGGNVDNNPANPYTVLQYPLGTKPDPNYQKPIFTFGPDFSPDGIIQYHGNAFGGALDGHLLITQYANGDDILDLTLNADGSINGSAIHRESAGTQLPGDPLSLVENRANGDLFVVNYEDATIVRLAVRP